VAGLKLIRSTITSNLEVIVEDFSRSYQKAPFSSFLVLPDVAIRDEVKRTLADQGVPVFGASICTLNEMAEYFFNALNRTEVTADPYTLELILCNLLEENQEQLTLFRGAWSTIHAIVPELRAFLEALTDFQVDYPKCLGELQSKRSEQLDLIRDLYFDTLSSNHLVDRGRMLEWVAREINRSDKVRIDRVIFYGLYEPKPVEKLLIKAIIEKARDAEYHIPYLEGNKAFADDGSWLGVDERNILNEHTPSNPVVTLFSSGARTRIENIAKGVFRDPLTEIRSVAREIRRLINSGTEPSEIIVILPVRSKAAPLVQEVFEDCGIPFNLHVETLLSESPVVVSIFSILDVVNSDYDRDLVIRLVSSPFFKFKVGGDDYTLTGSEVDELSIEAGIIGGKKTWYSSLDALAKQAMDELVDADEGAQRYIAWKVGRIERVRDALKQLFDELSILEGDLTVEERTKALRRLLQCFDLIHNLEREDVSIYQREVSALDAFLSALNAMEMGEAIAPSGKMNLSEFTARLRMLASVEGFYECSDNRNAVQVSGLRASYLNRYDYVFIVGMVDGDIPFLSAGNAFVKEREVSRMGLLTREDLLRHERFYFLSALLSSKVRTYVSRAESNGSDMLVPSYFFDELEAKFEMESFGDSDEEYSALCCQRLVGEMISRRREPKKIGVNLANPLEEVCRRIEVECNERAGDYRSIYDGIFADAAIISELCSVLDRKDIQSASRLESYACCPFIYYLNHVLGIEPRPEIETELSPADRGTLFHRIAFRFYSELRKEGSTRFTDLQLDEMTTRIRRIGLEELDRYCFDGPAWQAYRTTLLGSGERRGLLRAFLEKEASNASNLEPKYFELSFGLPLDGDADPASRTEPVTIDLGGHAIKLRCRIDRVDVLPDGRFVVIDYKTGSSIPSASSIEQGTALQLPLYIQAVEAAMSGMKGIGGAYYAVGSEAKVNHGGVFGDLDHRDALKPFFGERRYKENFTDIVQQSNGFVLSYLEAMRAGKFHPNKGPAPCPRGCAYSTICRADGRKQEGDDDAD
jgi:ATP-dependent helicase/nuclease subunit B